MNILKFLLLSLFFSNTFSLNNDLQIESESKKYQSGIQIKNLDEIKNIKILFFIELCLFSFFTIYWLCLLRRCNLFYIFIIINFFLLLYLDFIFNV